MINTVRRPLFPNFERNLIIKRRRHLKTYCDKPISVPLAYKIYRQPTANPPVFLLHGLLGSKANWHNVAQEMSNVTNLKVITIDARNHGNSVRSDKMTYAHMAEDIRALADSMYLRKVSLMGHTMGAWAAMYFALKYPERVASAVFIDICPTTPNLNPVFMRNILVLMKATNLPVGIHVDLAKILVDKFLVNSYESAETRNFIQKNIVPMDTVRGYGWAVNEEAILKNLDNHLAKFPVHELEMRQFCGPVLFIAGTGSDFILESDLPDIHRYFPKAKLHFIVGANHLCYNYKRKYFLSVLNPFLAEHTKVLVDDCNETTLPSKDCCKTRCHDRDLY